MIRARFKANIQDPRPVRYPPPHPWWVSGTVANNSACIVVAYADNTEQILELWPEAKEIDVMQDDRTEYLFTDRFPRPAWMDDPTQDGARGSLPPGHVKAYKVKLFQDASPCILRTWSEVLEHLKDDHCGEDMIPGERLTVKVITMDAAELDALPEWDGP